MTRQKTRQICFPLVGARSVGKTTFMAAFLQNFTAVTASRCSFAVDTLAAIDRGNDSRIGSMLAEYRSGRLSQTRDTKAVDVRLAVNHQNFACPHVLHIYDIAGEIFQNGGISEGRQQKQYDYSDGFIFIIDPLCLPQIWQRALPSLSEADKSTAGKAELNEVAAVFMDKLQTTRSFHKIFTKFGKMESIYSNFQKY